MELQVRIPKTAEETRGMESPLTLSHMARLAETYFDLCRLKDAEALWVELLRVS
jgi:hypothetical protein